MGDLFACTTSHSFLWQLGYFNREALADFVDECPQSEIMSFNRNREPPSTAALPELLPFLQGFRFAFMLLVEQF
jgi:hypothetical protein